MEAAYLHGKETVRSVFGMGWAIKGYRILGDIRGENKHTTTATTTEKGIMSLAHVLAVQGGGQEYYTIQCWFLCRRETSREVIKSQLFSAKIYLSSTKYQ